MKPLTRQQRLALKRVFDRNPVRYQHNYRTMRRLVQRTAFDDSIMLPWCGMWLGIEPDGYTHS